LTITADTLSATAVSKIEKAGGKAVTLTAAAPESGEKGSE